MGRIVRGARAGRGRAFAGHLLGLLLASAPFSAAGRTAPDYQLVNATELGKVLSARRHDAPTLEAALKLTLRDLNRLLGVAPKVRVAYQDAKTPGAGGASFTATVRGVATKGLVTCRVERGTAHVVVAFIRADAPPGEWNRLMRPPGGGEATASAGGGPAKGAHAPLRTYAFPDGTGSVGLAPGWSTDARSVMNGVQLRGPSEGEHVLLAVSIPVQLPTSPLARMPGALVAPFTTPAEVMRALAPQLSAQSARSGGPALSLDSLKVQEERPSTAPGGRAAVLLWGAVEQASDGTRRHVKGMTLFDMAPTTSSSFLVMVTQARGPDALYDRDLPVMLAMTRSLRTNDQQIAQQSQRAVSARQEWFKNQQAAHRQQVAGYDAHNRAWAQQQAAADARNRDWESRQNAQARRNDDFDEVLRGYRTVEDTRTGEKTSVTLGNVDKLVEDLNVGDPNRYRQIPLRDEMDPQLQR